MAHWIPIPQFAEMLHGYKAESTIKGYANGSLDAGDGISIEAKKIKINPKRRAAWCVDIDGEGAKALISKANEWKDEMEKPTVEELLEDARAEIESLHDTIDKLNETIVSKSRTIDDMQKTIDTLQTTIDSMEKGKPKRRAKRSTSEQMAADAELLKEWEEYRARIEGATVKDFAESIGRPRTTVGSAIRRAQARKA